jgi:hypothetical protein
MKVERGHVCNINLVHFWTVSKSNPFLCPTLRRGNAMGTTFSLCPEPFCGMPLLTEHHGQAALGRTSALIAAQKEKKSHPPKKARGKKASA